MQLARVFLVITALGSLAYALALVFAPGPLADLHAAPTEAEWVRYLVPVYAGLALIAWVASRHSRAMSTIRWTIVLIWAGLAVARATNMLMGDEPVEPSTIGFLAFDTVMALGLALGLRRARSA